MRIIKEPSLDFDDVCILPHWSPAASRKDIGLNRSYKGLHSGITITGIPIIASNMASTGSIAMAKSMTKLGCWTALHKFYTINDLRYLNDNFPGLNIFYTIGMQQADLEKIDKIIDNMPLRYLNIDTPNGYTQVFAHFIEKVRKKLPKTFIMAGNVCTGEMAQCLTLSGADCIKVGIGSGANCTTRIVAGVGRGQLSSLIDTVDVVHGLNGLVCSDGGCRRYCDPAKAFGAGADFVMLGNGLLGGTDECEGEWEYETDQWTPYRALNQNITEDNQTVPEGKKKYFISYGMASSHALIKHYGKKDIYRASEGKVAKIPYRGPVSNQIEEILGGIRSTCAYVGTKELKHLSKCTTFVRVNRTHNTVFGE